ncbi:MAG: hypothetical protein JOZ54_00135 [Acidobacteria bacterium]|nr:hypothetical protein [Acidobacteriota bacterium]
MKKVKRTILPLSLPGSSITIEQAMAAARKVHRDPKTGKLVVEKRPGDPPLRPRRRVAKPALSNKR